MSLRISPRNSVLLVVALTTFAVLYLTDYSRRIASARELLSDWNLPEAERRLVSLVDDVPSSLEARRLLAECLLKRGELRRATEAFTYLIQSDSAGVQSHLLSFAFAHFHLGNLDTASQCAKAAMIGADSSVQAGAFNLLGRVAFNRARYDSAMAYQKRSLALARGCGSSQREADALRQIGVLYWYHGKSDSARTAFYEPALELYRRLNDKIGEATTLNNRGLAGGGQKDFLEAFAIRRKTGDQVGLADSYYFITSGGLTHWFDAMYSFRKKSLDLSRRIGYKWGEEVAARAVEDMVVAAYDSVRFDPGVVDTAVARSGEQSIQQMLRQSSELARTGNWKEAAALRERVVTLCDSLRYTIGLEQALALHILALLRLGEVTKAEAVARRLATMPQGMSLDYGFVVANVWRAAGRTDEAVALLSSLTGRLDADFLAGLQRRDATFSLVSAGMLTLRYELHSALMDVLMTKGQTENMFDVMERFRSLPLSVGVETERVNDSEDESLWHRYVRTLGEIDSNPESIDRVMEEFDTAYNRSVQLSAEASRASLQFVGKTIPAMKDVREALLPGQVLVEYFLGTNKAYAIALRRDSSIVLELSGSSADVNSASRALRELLLRGKVSSDDALWKGPASFLFRILIQPIVSSGLLRDDDHLVVSPQGRLLEVPFACLLDANNRLLVDRWTISYIPSASHVLKRVKGTPLSAYFGLVPNRASLPFADVEIASIPPALFSSVTVLRDGQATTSALTNHAGTPDVVHIATHGSMHRWNPLFSHLQMHGGTLPLHRILRLTMSSRLVVLSSCETGYGVGMMGDIAQGHEVVSFPQAFLSAGASAVIAPLWVVEDEATARLMTFFYAELASSKRSDGSLRAGSFAKALSLAQRRFVDNPSVPPKTHPFFWAAFSLVGYPN